MNRQLSMQQHLNNKAISLALNELCTSSQTHLKLKSFVTTGFICLFHLSILIKAYTITQSRSVIVYSGGDTPGFYHYVIHSVASSDQGDTLKNRIDFSNGRLPIPLLTVGFKCLGSKSIIYCDDSFNADQIIQFSGIIGCKHISESLYGIDTNTDYKYVVYLMDIYKKRNSMRTK
jgi:hypothetical protein